MNEIEYRQHEGLGSTDVKNLLKSPLLYRYEKLNPKPPSPAMALGTAIHAEILEPDKKLVWPNPIDARTKAGKEEKAKAEAEGKLILSADQHQVLFNLDRWIKEFRSMMKGLKCEFPVIAKMGDVPIKGLLDAYDDFIEAVYDIKTVSIQLDASEVGKYAYNYGFHIQAGHYANVLEQAGMRMETFQFILIQTVPPFQVAMCRLPRNLLELGKQKALEAYTIWWDCDSTGDWGESEIKSFSIEFPKWAKE